MVATWLADVLRAAGVVVVEHDGWRTRAVSGSWTPTFGVVHATAAPLTQSDATQVALVRDGHSTLAGPISNAVVDRQGRWHVVAGGRCNSTLVGTAGPFKGFGNGAALSTEACNDNRGEPWSAIHYDSYARGWAAWCRHLNWSASRLVGHKEHTPGRKSDPTFDMKTFRALVQSYIDNPSSEGDGDMTPDQARMLHNLDRLNVALLLDLDKVTQIRGGDGTENEYPLGLVQRSKVGGGGTGTSGSPVVATVEAIREALADPDVLSAVAEAVVSALHRQLGVVG